MDGRVGIIGAMQVEVDLLVGQLTEARDIEACGTTFHVGTLGQTPVAIVRCGVGKVNAALCTQTLIERLSPACVINTGVAGSLDASLEIGDMVISDDLVQHDMDVTGLGYEPGCIPEMDGTPQGRCSFAADEGLRRVALAAAADVAGSAAATTGRIASGDQFVCTQEARNRIIATFGARCCEMEGAAIAQACWRNGVPFVVVRAISDKADGSSSVEYRVFERQAAERGGAIVRRAVELLGQEPGQTR